MSPRELLNRWIVPLDRRIDYLSLRYGVKFRDPLRDHGRPLRPTWTRGTGRLRRFCAAAEQGVTWRPSDRSCFDDIFKRVASARNMPYEPDTAEYLRQLCYRRR